MLKAYSGILSKSDSSILPKLPKYQDQESLATRTRTLPPSKNSNWFLNPKHSKQPGDVGTSSNITQFPKVVQPKDHVPTAFALPQTQRNHPKGWGETYASTTLPGGQHAVKCSWPVADLAKVADYLAKLNLSSKLIFYIFFVLNRVILNMVYLQLLSLGWTTCFRNMLTCKPGSGRRWRVTSQPFGISLTCHMPCKLAISLVRPHASCIEIRFTHTFKSCSWHNLWAENAWKRVLIKQDQIKSLPFILPVHLRVEHQGIPLEWLVLCNCHPGRQAIKLSSVCSWISRGMYRIQVFMRHFWASTNAKPIRIAMPILQFCEIVFR